MRILFELDKKDYDDFMPLFIRPSVRAIIIKDKQIYMVHSLKYNYYKFPGGGIEGNETNKETLKREVLEEAGLIVKEETIKEYGLVKRKPKGTKDEVLVQDNFYYLCEVENNLFSQKLDDYEEFEHFTLELVNPKDVIKINRYQDHGPKDTNMILREAMVLELLIDQGYFD